MKFKKVDYIPFFSKYVREDGKVTITAEDIKGKTMFIVTDENGNELEVTRTLKEAKAKYIDY